ncbi:MAG: hypothetical protein E2598_07045 [Sphingobium sp.]|nr:hypothetical protein [Sphingobium sp.]
MARNMTMKKGFLGRLAKDQAGNVLVITAAATIPMIAIVGAAVDISRAYLTRTRLQQACDAGVLAGRKSMTGLSWETENREKALEFFTMNFPDGKYGTSVPTVSFQANNLGAVSGTATTNVPMTLMAVFNKSIIPISVNCTADLQLPNTDIMFVLDTTLSMNDSNEGDPVNRITALRNSVTSFYNELNLVKPEGSHIRYGFVPYSSTVNVGMLLKPEWLASKWTYDSRIADGTEIVSSGVEAEELTTTSSEILNNGVSTGTKFQGAAEKCTAPANKLSDVYTAWSGWSPSSTSLPRTRTRTRTMNGTSYSASLSGGICWITPTDYNNHIIKYTEKREANPNAGKDKGSSTRYYWKYKPIEYDVSALKGGGPTVSGGSFIAPVENNHTTRTIKWEAKNACIEERATRRTNEGADVPMYDMDVDLVPNNSQPDTQWKPFLPGLVYGRDTTSKTATTGWVYSGAAETRSSSNLVTPWNDTTQYGACPSPSRKLAEITYNDLTKYLNALNPAGFTYHDIGFLWGLRLMSRDGIFKEENQAAEATGRVARHLIFMTDGDTDTRIGAYDAWGLSGVARRRTSTNSIPTNAAQNTITEDRLKELCSVAKDKKNITVWVIAFGTDLTSLLSGCASPNRAYKADNAAELTATFSEIASQIAQLRLTR